jgi:hypothetical protein
MVHYIRDVQSSTDEMSFRDGQEGSHFVKHRLPVLKERTGTRIFGSIRGKWAGYGRRIEDMAHGNAERLLGVKMAR